MLESLERRNLLLVALDRSHGWYRYHQLFRDLLRHDLARRERDLVAELHSRAARWHTENGQPESAIDHAQAAGDADLVADLILRLAQPVWASGRLETVLGWMKWLENEGRVDQYPAVAVHGALIFALIGQEDDCDRWAAAAERSASTEVIPDGSTLESYLAYLRALLCHGGVAEMRRDAQVGLEGLSPESPYRPTMLHTEGVSYLFEGDEERADALFLRALDGATNVGALPLAAVILVHRCLVAIERGDWAATRPLTSRAVSIVEDGGFGDYWTSALVYAWAARDALHWGRVDRGREYVARATKLRPLLTHALPVVSVQALLELTHSLVALGDRDGAEACLRQATDILRWRPGLDALRRQVDELQGHVDQVRVGPAGASSLTAAELRLLPFLPTHLTMKEIARRLFLSHATVKTQVASIYHKLGASSRSEAIEYLQRLGLLSG